jgi:hypothetical protein
MPDRAHAGRAQSRRSVRRPPGCGATGPTASDYCRGGCSAPWDASRSMVKAQTSTTTSGDAINAETRPRAPVARTLANPAPTSNTSLNNPTRTHRCNSRVDPERRALAVPSPRARSRMPTVRINNAIEDPDGMLRSHRKNEVGDPPNATPAQSRTAPMAMTVERSRLFVIVWDPMLTPESTPANETRTSDQDPSP